MRKTLSLTPAILLAALGALLLTPLAGAHAASPRMDGLERAVVRGINHHRAAAGLRPMRMSAPLARAADFHTREMLVGNYFAHSSRNGGSFASRIHRFVRARAVGETLAWMSRCGRRRASRRIVSLWMHSPPHRAILMSHGLHRVGIARRTGGLGRGRVCVVTGDFAR
jgi:uncharacterized protein YkwD